MIIYNRSMLQGHYYSRYIVLDGQSAQMYLMSSRDNFRKFPHLAEEVQQAGVLFSELRQVSTGDLQGASAASGVRGLIEARTLATQP